MNRPSKAAANQLRWSMPWRGAGARCKGCPYLVRVGEKDTWWQCNAAHDFAGPVSPGALCLNRLINFRAELPRSANSTSDTINDVGSEDFEDCTDDQFCPECGAALEKRGCFHCTACGYRECV